MEFQFRPFNFMQIFSFTSNIKIELWGTESNYDEIKRYKLKKN